MLVPLVALHVNSTAQDATVYASSFSDLAEGDFPPDLVFRGGSMQIDKSQGDAMLRFEGGSWFHIGLDTALPENFAIEFDYFTNESYAVLFVSAFDAAVSGQAAPNYTGYRQGPFNFFSIANTTVGVAVDSASDSLPKANARNNAFTERVAHIRLEVRGNQARIFVDGNQVLIHPAASLIRSDTVEFFYGSVGSPGNGYLGNIRILSL
jgi:hypothetical protein